MESYFLPLIFLYPELHYRFKYFPFSAYYVKEPEILIDLPYKSSSGEFPVFMIVKDAHLFPVRIWSVKFHFVFEDGSAFVKSFVINEKINKMMYYKQFDFSFPEKKGFTGVSALFNIYVKGSLKKIVNDNMTGIDPELEIYLDDNEELFENHIQGDLHYHSEFTSDQVEFGAPVRATKKCAETLKLDFFALTDHSYDLDDMEGDYLKNDPELNKFNRMRSSADEYSDDRTTILDGQEVTVRNSKERNVHILVYNQEYFGGSGDSAEKWFSTKSENSIFDITHKMTDDSLVVAAHPFNKIPLLEYLFVKRGRWNKEDIIRNSVSHLQILNGDFDDDFFNNLSVWTKLLLSGERIFIIAGNDAHGNFNLFRQIRFPMLKLICRYKQIFGKCRTVVLCSSAKKQDIIKTVKEGKCYITNGPHEDNTRSDFMHSCNCFTERATNA
ncbi:MAG: hypothetical protein R6V47_06960 [Candidatus Delongbacteria bacterium]